MRELTIEEQKIVRSWVINHRGLMLSIGFDKFDDAIEFLNELKKLKEQYNSIRKKLETI